MLLNTYDKQNMQELAYASTDPLANLVYNICFPAKDGMAEGGKFRIKDARTYFRDLYEVSSKFTTPQANNSTDAFAYYNTAPISGAFEFSRADLASWRERGYVSQAAMIAEELEITMALKKKQKEKALYTFVSTNANFASASYYADASVPWSTAATSNIKNDVQAGRIVVEDAGYEINAMIIPRKALRYIETNAAIESSTMVSGPSRNGLNPWTTVDFLKSYLNLEHIFVASGSLLTNTAAPASTALSPIWGDKALLFNYNPAASSSPQQPSWMKHIFWRPDNEGETNEGWIVNPKFDGEPGGVGVYKWGVWNYYTYLSHKKELAYRIDNLF